MALATRSAARFFAVFYRWSCSARTNFARTLPSHVHVRLTTPTGHTQCRPVASSRLPRYSPRLYSSTNRLLLQQDNPIRPTPASDETPPMKTAIRNLMRHVPSSVSVITVHATQPGEHKILPIGSAISSLTTVTLDPPHVSFNIKTPSRTLSAIHEAGGSFRVHFLDDSPEAASLARSFTEGNSEEVLAKRANMLSFAADTLNEGKRNPPRIVSSAVVASMSCQLLQEATVADHVVAIARVDNFRPGKELKPTLLYHQGNYKKNNGTILLDSQSLVTSATKSGEPSARDIYYNYSLFPGVEEKADFVLRLKTHLKQNPEPQNKNTFKYTDGGENFLANSWNKRPGLFGLNIRRIAAECGYRVTPSSLASSQDAPNAFRFYGTLSASDIAIIQASARNLVRSNPMVLRGDARDFLASLDVHPVNENNVLASDILDVLRDDGLTDPYEPRSMENLGTPITLDVLEQVENQFFQLLKTLSYEQVVDMPIQEMFDTMGIANVSLKKHLSYKRSRLVTEAFPEKFAPSHVDIAGHVNQEEIRIIVARLLDHLNIDAAQHLNSTLSRPYYDIYRAIGVHPEVSGVDLHFLLSKLKYLKETAASLNEFRRRVEEMRESILEKRTFSIEELDTRVKKLVGSHALRAARWTFKDITAALGIHRDALVKIDNRNLSLRASPQTIRNCVIRALKQKLDDDSVSAEEREAITERLQQKSKLSGDAKQRARQDRTWGRSVAQVHSKHAHTETTAQDPKQIVEWVQKEKDGSQEGLDNAKAGVSIIRKISI